MNNQYINDGLIAKRAEEDKKLQSPESVIPGYWNIFLKHLIHNISTYNSISIKSFLATKLEALSTWLSRLLRSMLWAGDEREVIRGCYIQEQFTAHQSFTFIAFQYLVHPTIDYHPGAQLADFELTNWLNILRSQLYFPIDLHTCFAVSIFLINTAKEGIESASLTISRSSHYISSS